MTDNRAEFAGRHIGPGPSDTRAMLARNGVTLMTAGLDEVPMAYKDIETVMAAQEDLVEVLAAFHPRLVKMAPEGSGAED